ncbi:hypothetical protein ACPXCJ_22485 [Micromonospora chalcea]|uniref:hypothetical protein n=1 Tax=Micromonospora chalcea TaxID=1874 RepID=UPI003CF630FD
MTKIFFNLVPPTAKECARIEKRLTRLGPIEQAAALASRAFRRVPTGKRLAVRWQFVARPDTNVAAGDFSDRALPPKDERPPSTRLISPRGIALRFYLTALFVAQSRSAGERPSNPLPLNDFDADVSWVDLVATPAVRAQGGKTSVSVRDKKLRQIHDALARLASPAVDLVELPNASKPVNTYENFLLKHERGRRYAESDEPNQLYTVPSKNNLLIYLPASFFLNDWVHVLEDSEIAMLLMIGMLHARYGAERHVYVDGETRLSQFGVGRDTYMAHGNLSRFGLLDVETDPDRNPLEPSIVMGYSKDGPPPKLHRFRLLPKGFEQPAVTHVREELAERLKQAMWR